MSAKFTPGPWRVHVADGPKVGPDDGFMPIGGCGCCGSPWVASHIKFARLDDASDARAAKNAERKANEEANARLIAAAPELHEACAAIVAALGPQPIKSRESMDAFDKCRAALAKVDA